jgi:hypothetical protein
VRRPSSGVVPGVLRAVACLAVGAAAGWLLAAGRAGEPAPGPAAAAAAHRHAGPTLERLAELSELVALTVDVADVQQTRVDGRVGGIAAVLAVRGDVQVGVDLSAARFEAVDAAARTATLAAPDPAASRPRLDHGRSRVVAVRSDGLWAVTPGDRMHAVVTDRAWAEAQRTVAAAAADPAVVARARGHAERVLRAHFAAVGWDVRVRWPGRP